MQGKRGLMAQRVKRGYGMRAHVVRMQLIEQLVAAEILEFVDMKKRKLHGEGHHDYTLRLDNMELTLLSGELEPFVAGIAWGMQSAGVSPPEGITDVYRPDGPVRGARSGRKKRPPN